jgi:hypothetical protein
MSKALRVVLLLILAAAVAGGVIWWFSMRAPAPAPDAPVATAPRAPASSAVPTEPAIQHPVEEAPPLAEAEVEKALADLLGRKAVTAFLQTSDFPRRFAATVDNLGRAHAPASSWPVAPTGGRFTVEERADGPAIGADNAARYTPLVLLAEKVDAARAAQLYGRMYPLLQRAYEELGYPKRYFNDRVVQVIDLLLATPEVDYPVKLRLVEVKGPIPSERPWVRYEYADPALESLSAGQKILVRVGPAHARRLKAKLAELRGQLAQGAAKR